MFEADRLLYIDLHKTGCSHIGRLLQETVGGRRLGKHNRPSAMPTDRMIIGSVRNPWDWYVSLWAFGCKGSRCGPWADHEALHALVLPKWSAAGRWGTWRWRARAASWPPFWHDLGKPAGEVAQTLRRRPQSRTLPTMVAAPSVARSAIRRGRRLRILCREPICRD